MMLIMQWDVVNKNNGDDGHMPERKSGQRRLPNKCSSDTHQGSGFLALWLNLH